MPRWQRVIVSSTQRDVGHIGLIGTFIVLSVEYSSCSININTWIQSKSNPVEDTFRHM